MGSEKVLFYRESEGNKETFRKYFQELREKSGLSIENIAEKLRDYQINISAEKLCAYENGTDSIDADLFLFLWKNYNWQNFLEAFSDSNAVQNIPPLDWFRDHILQYVLYSASPSIF